MFFWESTSIFRQCRLHSFLTKNSPSPKLLRYVLDLSSCRNLSNILSIFSCSIHIQVSFISRYSGFKTTVISHSAFVYLNAFSKRFLSIISNQLLLAFIIVHGIISRLILMFLSMYHDLISSILSEVIFDAFISILSIFIFFSSLVMRIRSSKSSFRFLIFFLILVSHFWYLHDLRAKSTSVLIVIKGVFSS